MEIRKQEVIAVWHNYFKIIYVPTMYIMIAYEDWMKSMDIEQDELNVY